MPDMVTTARSLPDPAPGRIEFDSALVIEKVRQTEHAVIYINHIKGKPTLIFVVGAFDPNGDVAVSDFLIDRRALVLADRDGTIKTSAFLDDTQKEDAAHVMLPSALDAANRLNEAGVGLAIVTNQGGYQSGNTSFGDTIAINVRVAQQVADAGGQIDAIFICPFYEPLSPLAPGVHDARKPGAGMTLLAKRLAADCDAPVLAMIGDQRTDGAAGQGADLKFFAVTDSNGRWEAELEQARRDNRELPTLNTDAAMYEEVPSFADAVTILLT